MATSTHTALLYFTDGSTSRVTAKSVEELKEAVDGVKAEAVEAGKSLERIGNVKVNAGALNFAAITEGISNAVSSLTTLQSTFRDLSDAYAIQEMNETRLETVMKQRMSASDAEVQSIKDLASAQQELGVIGDEVQLAGAQQVSTFLNETDSLKTLIPAMNNLVAQQKGLNATTGDAVSVGNMIGKVMQGEVGALKKVGITFSEVEAKMLTYGTEGERAAALAQIITNNVGEMNEKLAGTETGKLQQLLNTLGDMKEQLGGMVQRALPFVTIAAQAGAAAGSIATLAMSVKTGAGALWGMVKALTASNLALIRNAAVSTAVAVKQAVVTVATKAWTIAQAALNLVMSLNPIGAAIIAIAGLVAALVVVYNKSETFRKSVNAAIGFVKRYSNIILTMMFPALKGLISLLKTAAKWMSEVFGIGGGTVSVGVETTGDKGNKGNKSREAEAETIKSLTEREEALRAEREMATGEHLKQINRELAAISKKKSALEGLGVEKPTTPKAPKVGNANKQRDPVWTEFPKTIQAVDDNLAILDKRIKTASGDLLAKLNRDRAALAKLGEELRQLGLSKEMIELPTTIEEVENNIEILTAKLKTATVENRANINQQIKVWQELADKMKNEGLEPHLVQNPQTIKDLRHNLELLRKERDSANAERVGQINQLTEALEKQLDVIEHAGLKKEKFANPQTIKEYKHNLELLRAERETASKEQIAAINKELTAQEAQLAQLEKLGTESVNISEVTKNAWSGIRTVSQGIDNITEALDGNANAWQRLSSIIDGVLSLWDGIRGIVSVVQLLTSLSASHTAAKTAEAGAEVATTAATTAANTAAVAEAPAVAMANKALTASFTQLAAAKLMAANASLPLLGLATGLAQVATMKTAVVAAGVPAFAKGGIAYGPTLGLFGEYAGAANNPEVVAPLDKLRQLIRPEREGGDGGKVTFRIQGRELVGILEREHHRAVRNH